MYNDQTFVEPSALLNQLYWHSDRTVGEIVEETGISRSSLYSSILPIEAERSCPVCSEALFFTNRRRRTSGKAMCMECETEFSIDEIPWPSHSAGHPPTGQVTIGYPTDHGWSRWRDELIHTTGYRAAMICGAAIVAAAGYAAARALRD
jgi:hypothetical protein